MQEFEDFQKQLQWTLKDFGKAFGELLPIARAGACSAAGRNTCLSCDQHVQSSLEVSQMLAAGHLPERSALRKRAELSLSPETLPSAAPLPKRSPILAADPLGASSSIPLPNSPFLSLLRALLLAAARAYPVTSTSRTARRPQECWLLDTCLRGQPCVSEQPLSPETLPSTAPLPRCSRVLAADPMGASSGIPSPHFAIL